MSIIASARGTVYTVGHSTRSQEELLTVLREAAVATVADVRALPGSRRHPQFAADELARWLPRAGIRYAHLAELGGRRRVAANSPNGAWRERAFQAYADHMSSAEFARGLARLETLARSDRTAIMCAEAVWWRCHRRLIADALTTRGWRVEHLGVGSTQAVHELPPFAVRDPGGGLSYPPRQESLFARPTIISESGFTHSIEGDERGPERHS